MKGAKKINKKKEIVSFDIDGHAQKKGT